MKDADQFLNRYFEVRAKYRLTALERPRMKRASDFRLLFEPDHQCDFWMQFVLRRRLFFFVKFAPPFPIPWKAPVLRSEKVALITLLRLVGDLAVAGFQFVFAQ